MARPSATVKAIKVRIIPTEEHRSFLIQAKSGAQGQGRVLYSRNAHGNPTKVERARRATIAQTKALYPGVPVS